MKKKIEDYLHLYLGCKVKFGYKLEKTGRMVGLNKKGWQVEEVGGVFGIVHAVREELLKPILRPLTDITADEADYFAWLCMDSEHHLDPDCRITQEDIQTDLHTNDNATMLDGDVEVYIEVSAGCFSGAVVIKTDGSIQVYDEDDEKYLPVDNIAHKVAYLLSRGFDLFGLIPAGLAIDSTTLNPQHNG